MSFELKLSDSYLTFTGGASGSKWTLGDATKDVFAELFIGHIGVSVGGFKALPIGAPDHLNRCIGVTASVELADDPELQFHIDHAAEADDRFDWAWMS